MSRNGRVHLKPRDLLPPRLARRLAQARRRDYKFCQQLLVGVSQSSCCWLLPVFVSLQLSRHESPTTIPVGCNNHRDTQTLSRESRSRWLVECTPQFFYWEFSLSVFFSFSSSVSLLDYEKLSSCVCVCIYFVFQSRRWRHQCRCCRVALQVPPRASRQPTTNQTQSTFSDWALPVFVGCSRKAVVRPIIANVIVLYIPSRFGWPILVSRITFSVLVESSLHVHVLLDDMSIFDCLFFFSLFFKRRIFFYVFPRSVAPN